MLSTKALERIRIRYYSLPYSLKDKIAGLSRGAGKIIHDDMEDLLDEVQELRLLLAHALEKVPDADLPVESTPLPTLPEERM